MLITRPVLALTVTCILGVLPAITAFAADLTIVSTTAANTAKQKRAHRERPEAAKGKNEMAARKRPEKNRRKKISTYNLLSNPAFKHGTGVSGKARFGPANNGMGLGTGIDYANPGSAAPVQPNNISGMPPGTGYKVDPANGASASFDCREKSMSAGPGRREMTACFVHKLDKSWKTQTYVSRRSADGNTAWGGGLAVGYDY